MNLLFQSGACVNGRSGLVPVCVSCSVVGSSMECGSDLDIRSDTRRVGEKLNDLPLYLLFSYDFCWWCTDL